LLNPTELSPMTALPKKPEVAIFDVKRHFARNKIYTYSDDRQLNIKKSPLESTYKINT
jgi:hypothetical protein